MRIIPKKMSLQHNDMELLLLCLGQMSFTILLCLGKCWDNNNIFLHRGKTYVLPMISSTKYV